ncbi:hypothetical protein [Methylocapsa palsarum]|uniref:hypothetical protein n=1 Tax=Methylocapsa palsarum TaxID=1612308 RepID=UPI0011140E32|nr:hypothetical protein [Methylocapsa palsarum]
MSGSACAGCAILTRYAVLVGVLVSPVSAMAASGTLILDNRCNSWVAIKQNNQSCSKDTNADADKVSYISRDVSFNYKGQDVICTYTVLKGDNNAFLFNFSFNPKQYLEIKAVCKTAGNECDCTTDP